MGRPVSTVIDPELCIGCGDCIEVCTARTITMVGDHAEVTGTESLNCGHCEAVCPQDAIKVTALDPAAQSYSSFAADRRWLAHGEADTAQLVRLMASRRSCRNYLERPVERALLEDLVRIGITAPSATNSQRWTFTLVPTRAAMLAWGQRLRGFFVRVNQLARIAPLRHALRVAGRPQLNTYFRENYPSSVEAIAEWDRDGTDRLFHAAPAAIVVGATGGASMPADDALLATQNILLAAHAMGLGSCLIGFAVEAMRNDRGCARFIGIPDEETVHAVVALGHPNESYLTQAGRVAPVLRSFEPLAGSQ